MGIFGNRRIGKVDIITINAYTVFIKFSKNQLSSLFNSNKNTYIRCIMN